MNTSIGWTHQTETRQCFKPCLSMARYSSFCLWEILRTRFRVALQIFYPKWQLYFNSYPELDTQRSYQEIELIKLISRSIVEEK